MNHLGLGLPSNVAAPSQRASAQDAIIHKSRTRFNSSNIGQDVRLGGQSVKVVIQSNSALDFQSATLNFQARPEKSGNSLFTAMVEGRNEGEFPTEYSFYDSVLGACALWRRALVKINGTVVVSDSSLSLAELTKALILNLPLSLASKMQKQFSGALEVGKVFDVFGNPYDGLGNNSAADKTGLTVVASHDEHKMRFLSNNNARNMYSIPLSLFTSLCRSEGLIDMSLLNSVEFEFEPAASLADCGQWNTASYQVIQGKLLNVLTGGKAIQANNVMRDASGAAVYGYKDVVSSAATPVNVTSVRISDVHIMIDSYQLSSAAKNAYRSLVSGGKGGVWHLPSWRCSTYTQAASSTVDIQMSMSAAHARGLVVVPRVSSYTDTSENTWDLANTKTEFGAVELNNLYCRLGSIQYPNERITSHTERQKQIDYIFGNTTTTTILEGLGRSSLFRYQMYGFDFSQSPEAVSSLNLAAVSQQISLHGTCQSVHTGASATCDARTLVAMLHYDAFLVFANSGVYTLS